MAVSLQIHEKEIPLSFISKQKPATSTLGFHRNIPMTSVFYCSKKKESILLTSTMHEIDHNLIETKPGVMKPEIRSFYYLNKDGVAFTDEKCSTNDLSQICSRWTLQIFYHLLNSTGINASIVCHSVFPDKKQRSSRLLEEIGMEIVQH
ncbi:hypothetical protein TNCV_4314601 [Trichonephila clavipes]|nr:hypothetical protein TNCV_4314601 [Trichonephila clavipes]